MPVEESSLAIMAVQELDEDRTTNVHETTTTVLHPRDLKRPHRALTGCPRPITT